MEQIPHNNLPQLGPYKILPPKYYGSYKIYYHTTQRKPKENPFDICGAIPLKKQQEIVFHIFKHFVK
jgi:hypothetical protein